jgi:hypothetical protein
MMSEKAVVTRVYAPSFNAGTYTLVVEFQCTDGIGGSTTPTQIDVTSSYFNPILPNWRSRIKDAIAAYALSYFNIVVDDVLFPDMTIL